MKLSLSILITSAYRGLGGATIAAGQALSGWLAAVIAADPVLRRRRVAVMRELAGAHHAHPGYAALPDASYHYREHLGAVLREAQGDLAGALGDFELAVALGLSDADVRDKRDALAARVGS